MSTDDTGGQAPTTTPLAARLATWAQTFEPSPADRELARRSVLDTVAVALAAARHPIDRAAAVLAEETPGAVGESGRWAVLSHVLDFDDLHMPSTTHISTVCVPVALATAGGDARVAERAYLVGAGIMARLGTALGWSHYTRGWHATTTAGAPAAAAVAAVAAGLDAGGVATAMALAVPAAGGVQRAFGTDGKSLQVGLAAQAGVRAARLAAAGASADLRVLEEWLGLVGGDPAHPSVTDPGSADEAVPDGLAIKVYPACYALQRPIAALREAVGGPVDPETVEQVLVSTPRGSVQPLVHHDPHTGLEGKFSLEYAAATALLDGTSGFPAFDDAAVRRPAARAIMGRTRVTLQESSGEGLLDGAVTVTVRTVDGREHHGTLDVPPGAPHRPPSDADMRGKLQDCLARGGVGTDLGAEDVDWEHGAEILRAHLGPR